MYGSRTIIIACAALFAVQTVGRADEFDQPPINYSATTPKNSVSALQSDISRKKVTLRHEERQGYLVDLLANLKIPVESQLLVFSKTSRQRDRIAPDTPRAIYFNDETYVGFCHSGDVLEISTADPKLGTVFYTVDQNQMQPTFTRQTDSCLQCHGGTSPDAIPGHLVRSLFVDADGQPLLSEGSYRVDHTTPLENRWGGWYVTGTHGTQRHLGNLILHDRDARRPLNNDDGQNVTSLRGRFDPADYLTGHSDIVALLVFEHQTCVHNLITKANFTARQALYYETEFNRAMGEPPTNHLESTARRIESAADTLLEGLLFVNEAPLKGPIAGTSGYAQQFVRAAARDRQGRSLRDFDLKTRLFKYPCSYLIYSRAFNELPPVMKECVAKKLQIVLAGNGGEKFAHLSAADRQAILDILRDTKPDLLGPVTAKPASLPAAQGSSRDGHHGAS